MAAIDSWLQLVNMQFTIYGHLVNMQLVYMVIWSIWSFGQYAFGIYGLNWSIWVLDMVTFLHLVNKGIWSSFSAQTAN